MLVSKVKVFVAVLIVGGILGIGTGRLTYSAPAQDANGQPPTRARTDGAITSGTDALGPAHNLTAAKAALDQAQADLRQMEAALKARQADLAAKRAAFERAKRDEVRAQRNRQSLWSDRVSQNQTLTPQERLSQLERKLVEVLHEVQALRSQMDSGQQGNPPLRPADPRPNTPTPKS